jgi:hypothetical protein
MKSNLRLLNSAAFRELTDVTIEQRVSIWRRTNDELGSDIAAGASI